MRKPCKCSTRLCGWEESAAGFIGQPAGPREPRVNRSPVWCLLTEITGEGRACHFFKLKCKSTSANNGDGSRFYRNMPKDCELPQHKHRTQWSWSSFLLRKQSRNMAGTSAVKWNLIWSFPQTWPAACQRTTKSSLANKEMKSTCLSKCAEIFMQFFKTTKGDCAQK